jgi:GNAT superfamily N-acetyltransferase
VREEGNGGGSSVVWRRFDPERDDVSAITRLLHEAYAALGRRGLNYTAVDQDDGTTRRRLEAGLALLGSVDGRVIATATLYLDERYPEDPDLYRLAEYALFGQFAVLPELQGRGLGTQLCRLLEDLARDYGKHYLALDTAEPATDLIAFYQRLGFQHVQVTQWPGKKYRSVVMAKRLR